MKTPARVIPGALTKANEGACDWGWSSNLLAFGCQSAVVVFMPKSTQIIQVRRPDIIADLPWDYIRLAVVLRLRGIFLLTSY